MRMKKILPQYFSAIILLNMQFGTPGISHPLPGRQDAGDMILERTSADTAGTKAGAVNWIRPANGHDAAIWGLRNGVVIGLWPYSIEPSKDGKGGGPRGLIRVGYEWMGAIYLINFIAVEPVVNGQMEFSEISPSKADGKLGKFIWASDQESSVGSYSPDAPPGVISHPDPSHPDVEQLSLYLHMEQFMNGAHPYLRVSIRSDRPEEVCFEIFNEKDSAPMERCALTATMGNYSRLRLLYLKDRIVDARKLFRGFDGIDFIEKEGYPAEEMLKDRQGDLIVLAAGDESFPSLSSWPQEMRYYQRWSWRYRPFFKLTQYWRKESAQYDPSLHVRVNGRAKYWSGGSRNQQDYIAIPGGPAFENFELREKYYAGQKFYFGITRRSPEEILGR